MLTTVCASGSFTHQDKTMHQEDRHHLPLFTAWLALLVWAAGCLFFIRPALAGTIRLAPLPMENRETQVRQFRPLALYLEDQLKVTVELVFSEGYQELIEKFINQSIDLAYLGPLPYVELKAQYAKAEPLVHFNEASGKPVYTCSIIAVADSAISLQNVRSQKIALTQPLSTCGYLAVHGLLKEQGSNLEDNRYAYLDKHDAVALAVVRGDFSLGGVKTAIAKKYSHLGLKILAETGPMPSFGLVANTATLSPQQTEAITTVLSHLAPAGADKEMLATWGENLQHGAVKASDQDYDLIRRFKGGISIPTTNKN